MNLTDRPAEMGHLHCPLGHEHPQPFDAGDGRMLCGWCYHKEGDQTEMVPCTPDICDEEAVL